MITEGFITNVVILLPANQQWNLLTNKTTYMHICVTQFMGGSATLWVLYRALIG